MRGQKINPYDYSYNPESTWTIPAQSGLMIIDFLNEIIASQPNIGALMVYPKNTELIKDSNGNVLSANIEWEEHTADSFFNTANQENGAVPFMTSIAFKAEQLKHSYGLLHLDNIKNGIAVKTSELKEQDALSKL